MAGACWALAILAGTAILFREEYTPAAPAMVGAVFPGGSEVRLARTEPMLVVFSHPLCPCTRVTMQELKELRAEMPDRFSMTVVFTVAKGLPGEWRQGDLWRTVTALPGVRVMEDAGGAEARRFGVTCSGHCLVYAPDGRLLFSGGITGSRGHAGENPGLTELRDVLATGDADNRRTPTFGCSLL